MPGPEEDNATSAPARPAPAHVQPKDQYVYGLRRYVAALGLGLLVFISLLDTTIVAVALPRIGAEFNSYEKTTWVITGYLITYTAFLPIAAKLTDIIGRKYVLLSSAVVFIAFSGACGGAQSLVQLIVFRALQGLGGSVIYSGVAMTFFTMVPPNIAPKYAGIIGVAYAVSSAAGPVAGGAIAEHIDWAWLFWINLPIGGFAACLIACTLPNPPVGSVTWPVLKRRVDWIGTFLVLSSAVLLALSLQLGGTPGYPWSSKTVIIPLVFAVLLIVPLILVEQRHPEPIIPLKLLTTFGNLPVIVLFTLFSGAGFMNTVVFLPQRMQVVDSLSAITAGVRMLPVLLTLGVVSSTAGVIVAKTASYRPLMWFSSCVTALGAGLLILLRLPTRFWEEYVFEILLGLSLGMTIPVSTIIIQYSVTRAELASSLGLQSVGRMVGSLVGIAISTTVLNTRVQDALSSGGASSPLAPDLVDAIVSAPSVVIPSLSSTDAARVRGAYDRGYRDIFLSITVWFVLAACAAAFLQHRFPPAPVSSEAPQGVARGMDVEARRGQTAQADSDPEKDTVDVLLK